MTQFVDDLVGYANDFAVNDAAARDALNDVDNPREEWILAVAFHDHSADYSSCRNSP